MKIRPCGAKKKTEKNRHCGVKTARSTSHFPLFTTSHFSPLAHRARPSPPRCTARSVLLCFDLCRMFRLRSSKNVWLDYESQIESDPLSTAARGALPAVLSGEKQKRREGNEKGFLTTHRHVHTRQDQGGRPTLRDRLQRGRHGPIPSGSGILPLLQRASRTPFGEDGLSLASCPGAHGAQRARSVGLRMIFAVVCPRKGRFHHVPSRSTC